MNLVLLFESDFSDARTVRLSGRRFTHIATILKAAPGKKLIVGKLGGEIGEGRLDALDLQAQTVTLTVNWTRPPPPPVPITLVLAMPRPLVFKRVLTHVATLGVKRLIIIGSHRVEKSYFQTPLLQPSAIADILITALEQAVDTIMPQVSIEPSWPQFCHTHTDWIRAADALKRVAHPGAARVPLLHPLLDGLLDAAGDLRADDLRRRHDIALGRRHHQRLARDLQVRRQQRPLLAQIGRAHV